MPAFPLQNGRKRHAVDHRDTTRQPDAELIELGRWFDGLELRFTAAQEAELEAEDRDANCTDIANTMCPISLRITALPANTIEGLAVKAKIAKFFGSHFWKPEFEGDCDWDMLLARKLIELIEAAAARVNVTGTTATAY